MWRLTESEDPDDDFREARNTADASAGGKGRGYGAEDNIDRAGPSPLVIGFPVLPNNALTKLRQGVRLTSRLFRGCIRDAI